MSPRNQISPLDLSTLVLIPLIASGSPIAVWYAREFPPILAGVIRFSVAGLGLFCVLLLLRQLQWIKTPKDWLLVLLLGLCAVPINQYTLFQGTAWANPSHAAMIYAATPVVVTLLSCMKGYEPWQIRSLIGAGLATLGVVIIMRERGAGLTEQFLHGDLLLVVAMTTWSIYLVFARPLVKRYGALNSQMWVFLVGVVASLPLCLADAGRVNWAQISPTAWLAVGYMAFIIAGVNFFLMNWAMQHQPPSRVTTVANTAPLLTIFWRYLGGGDNLSYWFYAGAGLVFLAVVLAIWKRTPTALEPTPLTD
ncbi:MAG: DMT family transporter [Phycisphaerae bacterium]